MATAPELEIGEGRPRLAGLGSDQMNTMNKTKNTYPDWALKLRLPLPLLRARGIPMPLDDCSEGVALGAG